MTENDKVTGKVILHDFATLAKDLGVYLAAACQTLYIKLKAAVKKNAQKKDDEHDGNTKKQKKGDKLLCERT